MDKIEKIRQEIERRRVFFEYKGETPDERAWLCLGELIHFIDTLAEESVADDLEEEISRTYYNGSVADTSDLDHNSYENIARHFAEWQKEQDDKLLNIAYMDGLQRGKEAEREQMMKDAVAGTVHHYSGLVHYVNTDEVQLTKRLKQFNDCDEVKVIIIKENAN